MPEHDILLNDLEIQLLITALEALVGEFDTGREDWSQVYELVKRLRFFVE